MTVEHEWWPAIVQTLSRPWPREAALADLRWWAVERARRGRLRRRPGRPALARRWGWSESGARELLNQHATEARALDCDGIQ